MKFRLFAALFAALLIAFFTGSSANAASPFDNMISPGEMVLKSPDSQKTLDISTNYISIMEQTCATQAQKLKDIVNNYPGGGYWAITVRPHSPSNPGGHNGAFLTYTQDTSAKVVFHDGQPNLQIAPDKSTDVVWLGVDNEGSPKCNTYGMDVGSNISSYFFFARNYGGFEPGTVKTVLSTFPVTYPDGYEGEEIKGEAGNSKPIIRPDFSYTVTDKDINSKDHKKDLPVFVPDEGYTFNGYEVEWSLFKNSELIDHQILLQEKDYTYKVDEYGEYRLEARYLVQQCFRYPGYPATPDYCFYVDLGTEFDDVDFTSTAVNLKVDGSSSSGNTLLLECDVAGVCRLPDKTPASLFFSSLDNMNTHGLTQFFTAPITFLGTLPSKAETCTPITFPLMGKTVSMECLKPRYYEWSTAVMNIYTTLLIAGTGYLIAFNLFRHIKDINTPDKDKIEVARL